MRFTAEKCHSAADPFLALFNTHETEKPLFADPALRWVDIEGELALINKEVVKGLLHPRPMGVVVPNEHTLRPEHRPPFAQIRCDGMIIMAAVDVDNMTMAWGLEGKECIPLRRRPAEVPDL